MRFPFIKREEPLEKISIADTVFLIDHKDQELRQVDNPKNKIPFGKLKVDAGAGGIPILFDQMTKNLYEGYMPAHGLPLKTKRVLLRSNLLIDPQRLKEEVKAKILGLDAAPGIDIPDRRINLENSPQRNELRKGRGRGP